MIQINADGMSSLQLEWFLRYNPVAVRDVLTRFGKTGVAGLRLNPAGP